jgi:hypothetical protein
MTDTTALDAIYARMDEEAALDASGLITLGALAEDAAKHASGSILVQYNGQAGSVRYKRYDEPVDRIARVHPKSIGPGIVLQMPGWGSQTAGATLVKGGRIAVNDDDCDGSFFVPNASVQPANWATGEAIELESLAFSVKVPDGVTHVITAFAVFQVRPANSSVAIEAMMRIGAGNVNQGPGSLENDVYNVGPSFSAGNSDQWETVMLWHTRRILGTADTAVNGVKCNPRVLSKTSTSGSPNNPVVVNTILVGDTFRLKSATNLRSLPSLGADIKAVPPTNATGTVTGGPESKDGYTWYAVTMAGYGSGWIVKDQMIRTTSPATDPARNTRNYARSGWINVMRTPQ